MATHPHLGQYLGVLFGSDLELARIAERGLPLETLAALRDAGLSYSELASLVISPRTLKHRKARGEDLSQEETDRVVRMMRIVSLTTEVFGDREKAMLWLRSPDDRLGDRTPLSMLLTESGGRLVESMLWQVDEGVYS